MDLSNEYKKGYLDGLKKSLKIVRSWSLSKRYKEGDNEKAIIAKSHWNKSLSKIQSVLLEEINKHSKLTDLKEEDGI